VTRRLPGLLYLAVIGTGLFSIGYMPSQLFSSWISMPATLGEFGTCLALLIRPPTEQRVTLA